MGLWGDIAGGLTAVGGFVAAPFTGGASIPAGLSAAGAIIGGSAVSDAAKKQADATTQALNLQQQMYNTTRSDLAPYSQTGTAALGNLRQLVGLPTVAGMTQGTPGGAPGQVNFTTPQPASTTPQGVPLVQQPNWTFAPQTQNPVQMQTNSGYVTMKAPNGEMQQVDPAHVPFYQQKGATVLQ